MSWLRSVWSARRGICIASKAVRTATALGKFCLVLWFVAYFAEIIPQSRVFADCTQLLCPGLSTPDVFKWGRDDRWRHNHGRLRHLWKKNARKRCCWNCNIWPNWFTSNQSHYCLYYKIWHIRVCEETVEVNSKIAQTTQNIWNFIVRKLNL